MSLKIHCFSVAASIQRHGCHTADAQTCHEQRMTTDGATDLGVVATSDGRSVCFWKEGSRGKHARSVISKESTAHGSEDWTVHSVFYFLVHVTVPCLRTGETLEVSCAVDSGFMEML